ncbi:hypothetical protein PTSG_11054 [Salpingoeca rosetta]|uniref:Adenylate kinase n=1 Tax=Salpingoeca rosetta (strain ATCC 50818 / BSB-021) TaxID=946362 RepID=F2US04_SALR5|nr:uncharacterized protein PTSG_11054 [Salpingoeca rosetta]EGD80409.1 hypothetical protein PTSG_11054 [Salpingoeca rosetta]|eukprot:XP_004987973.1 hypothetical protein PTSG_11054 [Salpingoeca rosetta]
MLDQTKRPLTIPPDFATYAEQHARTYDAVYVNARDLITMAVSSGSKMGTALKPYVDRGMMVPDNLFTKLVVQRLWEQDCVTRGWVLDGFPLTRAQAEGLSKAGFVPGLAVFLDAPAQVCLDRLTLRRTDPITGKRYHLATNPPPSQDVLDRLKQHPDDEHDVVHRRMMDAQAFLKELKDFYKKGVTIDSARPIGDVLASVESHLVNPRESA